MLLNAPILHMWGHTQINVSLGRHWKYPLFRLTEWLKLSRFYSSGYSKKSWGQLTSFYWWHLKFTQTVMPKCFMFVPYIFFVPEMEVMKTWLKQKELLRMHVEEMTKFRYFCLLLTWTKNIANVCLSVILGILCFFTKIYACEIFFFSFYCISIYLLYILLPKWFVWDEDYWFYVSLVLSPCPCLLLSLLIFSFVEKI